MGLGTRDSGLRFRTYSVVVCRLQFCCLLDNVVIHVFFLKNLLGNIMTSSLTSKETSIENCLDAKTLDLSVLKEIAWVSVF